MNIYFLRHASAGQKKLLPSKDEQRPLDEQGVLQTQYAGRLLAALDVTPDHIISSPLKRARQTASLAANELAYESELKIEAALRPQAGYEEFEAMLSRYKRAECIVIVGHNPNFTEFLSRMISGKVPAARLEIKKGGIAKVELNGKQGTLHWMITPKIAKLLQAVTRRSVRPKTSRK